MIRIKWPFKTIDISYAVLKIIYRLIEAILTISWEVYYVLHFTGEES